ncbi:hypothetical protein PV08_00493 [Exophiala spinifera]|uniref:Uncharacterized protein n=1 Tax=Exophiala spinifera TaxID=91928 RepID=A0A0D2BLU3_9EURO|nr:uncharacterized protein PV08_00493 [Exophiala spinifera]KIW19918.1 hypothetical protein PV08_00493 [Exophiala spinifera]
MPAASPTTYLSLSNAIPCTGYPAHIQAQQMRTIRYPEYQVRPLLSEVEESPVAAAYTSFREWACRQIDSGASRESILGPEKVEVDLFFRARGPADPHTVSTWACEFFRALEGIDVFVCLAGIFNFDRFMRWMIVPSAETYAKVPPGQRPTACQRLVPHHPASDLPVLPELRDALIYDMRDFILASQCYGTTINWDGSLDEAIDIDPETANMTISDAFAEHSWHMDNWTFSRGFAAVFPELRHRYRISPAIAIPPSPGNVEELLQKRDRIRTGIKREGT